MTIDAGLPVVQLAQQPGPPESIRRDQLGPPDGALQNAELMAKSKDLELQRHTPAEESG